MPRKVGKKNKIVVLVYYAALFSAISNVTNAQDPIEMGKNDCRGKSGWFFCTPDLQLDKSVTSFTQQGYCCELSEMGNYSQNNLKKCTPSEDPLDGVQCSHVQPEDPKENILALKALYSSYSLGMEYDRNAACPTGQERDSLDAYIEVTSTPSKLVMNTALRPDPTIETVETCYWVLRPQRNTWIEEQSQMTVWLESIEDGYIFLMEGTERNNVTKSVIEDGLYMVQGAPIVMPLSNDIVIIFPRKQGSLEARFTLGFQITGEEYPWWEKAFIGVDDIWWYLFLYGIPAFIVLMILICLCCCISKCCNGTCCCKCCNCGKGGKVSSQVEMLDKQSSRSQVQPSSNPAKIKTHQVMSPGTIINSRKHIDAFGDESDDHGPIPPTPPNAVMSPRDQRDPNDSRQAMIAVQKLNSSRNQSYSELPPNHQKKVPPIHLQALRQQEDERLRPSSIYKNGRIVNRQTPMRASQQQYYSEKRQNMDSITSANRTSISGFDGQQNRTPNPTHIPTSSKGGHRNSVEKQTVLFDEEAADRFEKENSFGQIDLQYNPDENEIDPVTVYRFQENTRRLDRLRAEIGGNPGVPGNPPTLPASRNSRQNQNENQATIDQNSDAYGTIP